MLYACLTVREASQAETKVDHTEPETQRGLVFAQRIKGTPGITGLYSPRAQIDGSVWHLNKTNIGANQHTKHTHITRRTGFTGGIGVLSWFE